MSEPIVLDREECLRLLCRSGVVGRVAFSAPDGPDVVPVNYSVVDEAVIVRTTAYSALGTQAAGRMLAFEADHADYEQHGGWSVVVRGRAEVVEDPDELRRIREVWEPRPWASGTRTLYLRIPCQEVSGRRLGPVTGGPAHRTLSGE